MPEQTPAKQTPAKTAAKQAPAKTAAKQTPAKQALPKKQLTKEELAKIPGERVLAEMVANVWKVVVKDGDEVEEGDTLVILESMKMEIPVLAESDGVVRALGVAEGDVVQEGDLIAVVG
jgi:biotin carboxyl carrier protein